MARTSIVALLAAGGFVAAAMAILTWGFYGSMMAIPVAVSVTLWLMTAVCTYLGLKMRERRRDGRIGLDRSQLHPVTAARYLILGKASAWTGAIIGGAYVGIATYVIPQSGNLQAAAGDMPGVVASALGGIALSAAGVFLERNCEVPPPAEGEPVG